MKTKYLAAALGVALMGLTSCSNFLEEEPNGRLATENFFQSNNDLTMALNALYYNVASSQQHSNPYITDCQGSDMTSSTGGNKAPYLAADGFSLPSDYKGCTDLWRFCYNVIQASNLIIDNADKAASSAGEQNVNIAKGNAYFWRALSYFRLVRVFGPLPINAHNEPDGNNTPMTDVAGVYKFIEDDLEAAVACNLPATYSGLRKDGLGFTGNMNIWVTKQAVEALQCAVFMNHAGYPLNDETYWEKAADKAYAVYSGVKNGTYQNALVPEWKQVYSVAEADNTSSEMLIGVTYYTVPGQMGSMGNYVSQFSLCHRFGNLYGGWGDFIGERHFWKEFPEGPRKDAVYCPLLRLSSVTATDGSAICVDWWATSDEKELAADGKNALIPQYHPMFAQFNINADADGNALAQAYDYTQPCYIGQSYPQTHRTIRLAEVYCWLAECAGHCGKYTAEATDALQQVMARAYTTVPAITDLAEQGYKEHTYEVAGYPLGLCSVRSDEFRTNKFYSMWQYRSGEQTGVIVPKGTLTHSYKREKYTEEGNPRPKYRTVAYTYELAYDLVLQETTEGLVSEWAGENSIYQPYPPEETEKNPNIKR